MAYSANLGAYMAANHPNSPAEARSDGTKYWIEGWPQSDGPEPTPEQVAAWTPTPPDPAKALAPRLEIRDYKALDAALESATTVMALRAVFRQYLRRRAGL